MDYLSLAKYICPDLMTGFTFIPMGDIFLSGDLHVGHNNLGLCMLVDSTEANNNTWKICTTVGICQIQIHMAAGTLINDQILKV